MSDSDSDFEYYLYTPSLAAAAVFVVIFAISTLLHCWQCLRGRSWYMIALILGGLCETVGYIGRTISAHQAPDYSLGPYIVQSILILIAPALMSASVYMVLGCIIVAVNGEARSPIKRKSLTITFVLGDVWSFMIQSTANGRATGAGLLVKKDPDAKNTGKWIIIGGLAVQLIFFGLFIIVSLRFNSNIRKSPTSASKSHVIPWRRTLYFLYAASILIMIRSVFRVAEYVQGDRGYLLRRELWLYIFDAALMASVMLLFNIVHPSKVGASSTHAKVAETPDVGLEDTGANDVVPYPQRTVVHGSNAV
ncbi:MAG: hypothetical protein Q9174_003515 [Haloplaca sp. 1 TL-2023]